MKISGDEPGGEALKLLKAGCSKQAIRDRTGHAVGVNIARIKVAEGEIFVVMGRSGSGKSPVRVGQVHGYATSYPAATHRRNAAEGGACPGASHRPGHPAHG